MYWYMCLNVFLTIRSQFLKIPKFCSLLIGGVESTAPVRRHAAYSRGTRGGPPPPPAPGKFFNDQPMNDQTLNDQTLNDQTLNDQTLNDQTLNDQTLNDQTLNDQTFNDQTFNVSVPSYIFLNVKL